jgi:hypothetical protein
LQVVPLKEMTLETLALHDGTRPLEYPLRLAIQGVVYDITKGSQFYGPDGCYPFAGRECARAFALLSTETTDCNGVYQGCTSRTDCDEQGAQRAQNRWVLGVGSVQPTRRSFRENV